MANARNDNGLTHAPEGVEVVTMDHIGAGADDGAPQRNDAELVPNHEGIPRVRPIVGPIPNVPRHPAPYVPSGDPGPARLPGDRHGGGR